MNTLILIKWIKWTFYIICNSVYNIEKCEKKNYMKLKTVMFNFEEIVFFKSNKINMTNKLDFLILFHDKHENFYIF